MLTYKRPLNIPLSACDNIGMGPVFITFTSYINRFDITQYTVCTIISQVVFLRINIVIE